MSARQHELGDATLNSVAGPGEPLSSIEVEPEVGAAILAGDIIVVNGRQHRVELTEDWTAEAGFISLFIAA